MNEGVEVTDLEVSAADAAEVDDGAPEPTDETNNDEAPQPPQTKGGKISNYIGNMSNTDLAFVAIMVVIIILAITVPVGVITSRSNSEANDASLEEVTTAPPSPSQCSIEYSNDNNTDANATIVTNFTLLPTYDKNGTMIDTNGTVEVNQAPYLMNTIDDIEYESTPEPQNKTENPYYFNYNTTEGSMYGPDTWGDLNMNVSDDINYWEVS